ncbi:MAG: hypothetical protein NTZ15_14270, partial [Burkholderiales bacterium]|nr:hypothetical protein [Burkholderiales bacterium]
SAGATTSAGLFVVTIFGHAKIVTAPPGALPGRGCQWRYQRPKNLQAKSTVSAEDTSVSSYQFES